MIRISRCAIALLCLAMLLLAVYPKGAFAAEPRTVRVGDCARIGFQ